MKSINHYIEMVTSDYNKGEASDDSRLSPLLVFSHLNSHRNTLMYQKIKAGRFISDWSYSKLNCVVMDYFDMTNCPQVLVNTPVIRSKERLPSILSGSEGYAIKVISKVGTRHNIDPINMERLENLEGYKYQVKEPQYYIEDGYLYLIHSKPTVLTVVAIVANPLEVRDFNSKCPDCDECIDCRPAFDLDFPIEEDLENTVVEMTKQSVLNIFVQVPEDITNNSRDGIIQQTK